MVSRCVFRDLFRYPDPVNENAARLIAGGVLALVLVFLMTGSGIVVGLLAYGFVARVLTGPTLSPLAQIVNRVIVPRLSLPVKPVSGPPKRFAQGIGAVLSVGALVAFLSDVGWLAFILAAAVGVASMLEAAFAFCIGCWIFARLMATGLVPSSVCEACNDLSTARRGNRIGTGSSAQ